MAAVYDVFHTSQMIFMAQEHGIVVYDRYMQTTSDFPLASPAACITVFHGSLVGVCVSGDVIIGDNKGGFDRVRFGKNPVFSIAAADGQLYACTARGLYRFLGWKGSLHLCSVKLGFPVTDLAHKGDDLYLATYFQGLQTIALSRVICP